MELFDWDDANILHFSQHGVGVEEAQEALLIAPVDVEKYVLGNEIRLKSGSDSASRVLKVISTERHGRVRVVTAFDASAGDKRRCYQSMVML